MLMEDRKGEGELYREIVRRAQRIREAAAESLRGSRAWRKKQEREAQGGVQRGRRFKARLTASNRVANGDATVMPPGQQVDRSLRTDDG